MISSKIPLPNVTLYERHSKEPNITYFIFSEGDRLEYKYFKGLSGKRKFFNINALIDIETLQCNETNPMNIYNKVINSIHTYIDYDDIKETDFLLFIFDRDKISFTEEQYDYLLSKNNQTHYLKFGESKTSKNKVIVAVSNSSFEFWLMCHYLHEHLSNEDLEKILMNEKTGNKPYNKKKISDDIGLNVDNFTIGSFMKKCSAKNFSDYDIILRKAIDFSKNDKYASNIIELKEKVGTNVGVILEMMLN
ncbi:MAG: RloB domain-containing protein [Acholeplasma sp.]|nr:RloB domain-containing protein [Acholeplasma sp.]